MATVRWGAIPPCRGCISHFSSTDTSLACTLFTEHGGVFGTSHDCDLGEIGGIPLSATVATEIDDETGQLWVHVQVGCVTESRAVWGHPPNNKYRVAASIDVAASQRSDDATREQEFDFSWPYCMVLDFGRVVELAVVEDLKSDNSITLEVEIRLVVEKITHDTVRAAPQ